MAAPGTERESNGRIPATVGRAGEKQAGQVDAGDQQHQSCHAHQHRGESANGPTQHVAEQSRRRQLDVHPGVIFGIFTAQISGDRIQSGLRLRVADARFQTPDGKKKLNIIPLIDPARAAFNLPTIATGRKISGV